MQRHSDDDAPRPLPRAWLPDATAPDGAPEWQFRAQRILAAAEPKLRTLGKRSRINAPWPALLGLLWKPAAVLAAVAAALLFKLDPAGTPRETGRGSLPLSFVAAEGEPFAFFEGLGIEADPVLALIALQEQGQ